MQKKFKQTKDRVAELLEQHPELRDNDMQLILAFWARYDGIKGIMGDSLWNIFCNVMGVASVTSFETIRRCRQRLNEQGQYIGKTYRQRKAAAREVEAWVKLP